MFSFRLISLALCLMLLFACTSEVTETTKNSSPSVGNKPEYVIVVHGGAGIIKKELMTDSVERIIKDAITKAIERGADVLEGGGEGLDAVIATITFLEDHEYFNAGKGAVLNSNGFCELDASIMEGKELNAGAVAGVSNIKNPIIAARAVMEKSKHVMLSGVGAFQFAEQQGLELVDSSYFISNRRFQQYLKEKTKTENAIFETVGCVVLDKHGNLSAGTSTGGVSFKKYGRIGDSPIIGAGTYADNNSCAVSCTGIGEYFIRYSVAHDLSSLVQYKNLPVREAADIIINQKLSKFKNSGGLIAVDKNGEIAMTFNTPGMIRAYKKAGDSIVVDLYEKR